jgi:hypothetical protein
VKINYNPLPSIHFAKAALRRGPLLRNGARYRCGQRAFSSYTINRLLQAGEARRVGNTIVRGK